MDRLENATKVLRQGDSSLGRYVNAVHSEKETGFLTARPRYSVEFHVTG